MASDTPDPMEAAVTGQALPPLIVQTLLDATYDWEMWIDSDGCVRYCSPSCMRITGYSPAQFIESMTLISDIIHADDRVIWESHRQRLGEHLAAEEIAFRITNADGSIRWIEHACQPVTDRDGAYIGRRVSNRDVTERKHAETKLSRQSDLLQLATRISTRFISLAVEDIDHGIEEALMEVSRLLDADSIRVLQFTSDGTMYSNTHAWWAPGVPVRRPAHQMFPVANLQSWFDSVRENRIQYNPDLESFEPSFRDTAEFFVRYELLPIISIPLEHGGVVFGFLSFEHIRVEIDWCDELRAVLRIVANAFSSVLYRQKSEQLAKEEEVRWKFAMDESSDGVWDWDVTTGHVFYSPRFVAILGYTPEEFPERFEMWSSLLHPDDTPYVQDCIEKHLRGETPFLSIEYRIRHKLGECRWIHASGIVVRRAQDGSALRMVGIVTDTTQRREQEENVRRSRDQLQAANIALEHAAHMKDEFLANMSHELRTPLTSIIGMAEVLQMPQQETLTERQLRFVRIIHESGLHLLELINDVLDLAKIETGHLAVETGVCPLESMAESVLRIIHVMAQKKGHVVTHSISPAGASVIGDSRRLSQIIVNLMSNAIKFTKPGGTIALEMHGNHEEKRMCISVRDSGIGIAPDDISRLFIPFSQLEGGLSREHTGAGLGLSLVRSLAELHGGSVAVESTPGVGSCFTVILPWDPDEVAAASPVFTQGHAVAQGPHARTLRHLMDDAPAASPNTVSKEPGPAEPQPPVGQQAQRDPAPHADPTKKPAPGIQVLIAEDNQVNREMFADMLRTQGFDVLEAADGSEAIALAEEARPDLIIMDIHMPGLDGISAIKFIRTREAVAHIPILALTSLAMPGDRERCLAAGANEYLSKPIDRVRLTSVVLRLLS